MADTLLCIIYSKCKTMKKFAQNNALNIFSFNILLLSINLFVVVMQGSQRPTDLWMFDSIMDKPAKERFNELLKTFSSTMEKHNITYFMYQGTLLGSYRHHGHLAWDDDIDFMLNITDKEKMKEITKNMGVQYAYYENGPTQIIKFFYRKTPWSEYSTRSKEIDITWPHVDVSFFVENDTHIWDPKWAWQGFNFPKTEVFPLTRRPFDGLMLPAPCHPEKVLKRSYDMTRCRTHMFNHKLFVVIPYFLTSEKKCDALRHRVPFVNRFQNGYNTTEKLQIQGWTIQEFEAPAPCGEPPRKAVKSETTKAPSGEL